MPGLARLLDLVNCREDKHLFNPFSSSFNFTAPVTGNFTEGSDNVFCNDRKAIRVGDAGVHTICPGPNSFKALTGASNTFINDRAAVRVNDKTLHCNLSEGSVTTGSDNTEIE